ncbi:hypothetical protein MHK_009374 [Candidatus Magnetomorum sp. HK-1]|nr:hypothetical protein MHK_009374 [Candidatus Magnetomorum sp. HK-1]
MGTFFDILINQLYFAIKNSKSKEGLLYYFKNKNQYIKERPQEPPSPGTPRFIQGKTKVKRTYNILFRSLCLTIYFFRKYRITKKHISMAIIITV